MRRLGMLAPTAIGIIAVVWLTFSWFEAGSEIEVLCSTFHAGLEEQSVRRTLETGEYLRYQVIATTEGSRIDIDRLYNLGTSTCIVEFSHEGVVTEARLE